MSELKEGTFIRVGADISEALHKIQVADGPIRVRLSSRSCHGGNVFELMAISAAMASHPHDATAVVCDTVSIAALIEADEIIVLRDAVVYVGPLRASTYGDKKEQKDAADTFVRLSEVISDGLVKWPEIQRIFNNCESRFLTGDEFKKLTEGEQHEQT